MSESKSSKASIPVGGLILAEGDIEINAGRPTITMKVRNTGDRPIQVCSHFHFFETNRYLEFDRAGRSACAWIFRPRPRFASSRAMKRK